MQKHQERICVVTDSGRKRAFSTKLPAESPPRPRLLRHHAPSRVLGASGHRRLLAVDRKQLYLQPTLQQRTRHSAAALGADRLRLRLLGRHGGRRYFRGSRARGRLGRKAQALFFTPVDRQLLGPLIWRDLRKLNLIRKTGGQKTLGAPPSRSYVGKRTRQRSSMN